jgi:hypothetical protein
MTKESDNKAIVGRWFTNFLGETCDLSIVDELAAPDMLLQYSLHEARRGREDIKAFMTGFLAGSLPAATGRKMHFTGTTVLRLENGKIVEEIGLDDGVTALTQLGLIRTV